MKILNTAIKYVPNYVNDINQIGGRSGLAKSRAKKPAAQSAEAPIKAML